jgi:hypothetical protein
LNGFNQIRGEIEGYELVSKAVDPYGVECHGHIKENCACELLLAKVLGNSFKELGQLQGCAMLGSETKLLFAQKPTLFSSLRILLSRIFSKTLPIVSRRLMGR